MEKILKKIIYTHTHTSHNTPENHPHATISSPTGKSTLPRVISVKNSRLGGQKKRRRTFRTKKVKKSVYESVVFINLNVQILKYLLSSNVDDG